MMLRPAVLALLLLSALGVAMLMAAAPFAVQLIRRWDLASGSERQVRLERRTYLFSTLVALVLVLQLAGVLLFVYNADHMAVQFVGAMCAVGSLNAGPLGFAALLGQVAMFFLSAMWLAINHLDSLGRDYPLVKVKYGLMLGLLPCSGAVLALQWVYFSSLRPEVITSCCGNLFAEGGTGISSDLAALPPAPSLAIFCAGLALAMAAAFSSALRRRGGCLTGLASALAFGVAIAGMLSFLSLYIYEHPHHHCPFCLLKREYGFLGYALYVPLFAATAAGLAVGAIQPFRGVPSLAGRAPVVVSRLSWVAALGFLTFFLIALALIGRSHLMLL